MLPAHYAGGGPRGRRQGGQQQQHYHAAAAASESSQHQNDDARSSSSRRRGVPYGRRQRVRAALMLLLPALMFASVLYKRSGGRAGLSGGGATMLAATNTHGRAGRPQLQEQAEQRAPEAPPKLRLSTFGKNETARGETAQVWLTLANEAEQADGTAADVALSVYLPHPALCFHAGSAFPTLEPTSGADPKPAIDEDTVDLWEDGRRFTLVRFPAAPLAAGKSRVYNVEARVGGFDGDVLEVFAQALQVEVVEAVASSARSGGSGGGQRPLASVKVTLGKKHVVTNDELSKKRESKVKELEKKRGVHFGGWRPFDDCTPLTPLAAAATACFAACHPKGADACLACGYNQPAEACICKTPAGGQETVPIDPLPTAPAVKAAPASAEEDGDEEEEEGNADQEFEERVQAQGGRRALFSDPGGKERIAEILVFPGLVSEADCQRMDDYLEELVAHHGTPRKIVEEPDSPLHKVLGRALQAVVPSGVEYLEYVTFSKETVEVSPHYDSTKGEETHKVLLFLDGVAGTRFWETEKAFRAGACPMSLPAARGTVVVFPMALYHDSQRYEPHGAIKSTLGLRSIFPPFEGTDTLGLVVPPRA